MNSIFTVNFNYIKWAIQIYPPDTYKQTTSLVISQNLLILKCSLKYIKINEPIQWQHTVQSSKLFHLITTLRCVGKKTG